MPLPSKKPSESKKEFIARCMGDKESNKTFPDQKQRAAVCFQRWGEKKSKANLVVQSGDDEIIFEVEAKKHTLPPQFQKELLKKKEDGQGYHKVGLKKKDGQVISDVMVYNCQDFYSDELDNVDSIAELFY